MSDFDAIYQEYGKTVYCFLLSLSRDETLSEELTQETMFRDIAAELADKDIADRILQHLHELEEPYKEVFTLHALGDIPLKRISQLFGKSDSWARVTYYRAKVMITAKLEEGEK